MCISPKFGGLLDSDKMAKAKILVVEDEAITAMDIQNRLKELDYDVPAIAASGEGAIKSVEEIEPDLVVMDIILKGMDGIEAAEQIHDRFDVPVVYVTAYLDEELLEKTKVSEPYGYITKPFEDKDLRPAIEMALQRHKLEKALRESEEKIRSITASARDAIIMVDNEETISYWNEAAERIFGYTAEEMIGTKLHGAIIPERFREAALNGFKSFRETGQGAAVGKTLELAANRKDGMEFPVELSLSAVKLKGKWNAIGLIRDITERKQAEGELIEVKERLNYTIQNMKDIIFSIDLMGNYTYTNIVAAEITGYSVDELLKMNMRELVAPEYHELVFGRVKKRIAGEPPEQPLSIEIISKDGKRTWLELTTSAAHDKDGKLIGIQGIARDITERKQAENTIKKKTEALKRFNKLAVGRELRMIELKNEINALLEQLGEEPRYNIVGEG